MVLDLPESGYCGEAISGACTATDSSRLTLDISGLESHTFTPNRDKSVEIEGVSLHLVELTPTQENFKFVVSISFTLNETVTISCINDKVDETHRVLLKSNSPERVCVLELTLFDLRDMIVVKICTTQSSAKE